MKNPPKNSKKQTKVKLYSDIVMSICNEWPKYQASKISGQLGGVIGNKNYTEGVAAEKYVAKKISEKSPKYFPHLTMASKTPADIIAFSTPRNPKGKAFFHVMLIQVKSTQGEKVNLARRTKSMKENLLELAEFVRDHLKSSPIEGWRKRQPFLVSIGYAGVLNKGRQKYLVKCEMWEDVRTSQMRGIEKNRLVDTCKNGHELPLDDYFPKKSKKRKVK